MMTCLLSEALLAKQALYILVIVCRRQLPHSGFPLVRDPPPPLKHLACPPHKLALYPTILAKKHCFATQFLIIVKMFLPLTGLSLLWGMGGDSPPAKNLLIHPPGKTPPVDSTIVCTPFLLGG